MMDKSITVLAPSYNHERFIERCLWSVADQKCDDIELIVIDDCSQDHTRSHIEALIGNKEFRDVFSQKIRYIQHKRNMGAHFTINEGLNMAKGNFLTVINTDDAFGSGHLNGLLNACEEYNSEFAFGGVKVIDENDLPRTDLYGQALTKYQCAALICPTVTMALARGNSTISTGNMVFSARLYKELNGFRNYRYVHDWDFALRAALLTEPVFVPEALYYYRLHGGNTISEISAHPENADKSENRSEPNLENPLISFFRRIIRKEYVNEKIPSREVWEYFMTCKKYYDDDYSSKMAWNEAVKIESI